MKKKTSTKPFFRMNFEKENVSPSVTLETKN